MNAMMRISAAILFLIVGIQAQANFDKVATPTGNHCLDQMMDRLQNYLQYDVAIHKVSSVKGATKAMPDELWVKTNLCDGHIVAVLRHQAACKDIHYGSVPNYIQKIYARGASCKQVVPEDIYPN